MASFQTPASSAFAQQGSAADSPYGGSPRTSTSASQTNVYAYSNDLSANGGNNQPLTLASPQLQPLPDFQRLSFSGGGGGATPRKEEPPRSFPSTLIPPVGSQNQVPDTPVSGYQSNTPALAPPQDGWGTNRTSLAYLGEAPSSEGGHGDIEAREAQQAFEDEARAKDSENGHAYRDADQDETSRSYSTTQAPRREEGLATISEAMLETSPVPPPPSTLPIPSPDVPADVQSAPSIDSIRNEPAPLAKPTESQPREYQPLLAGPPAPPPPQDVPVPITPVDTSRPRPTSIIASPPAVVPLPLPSPLHAPNPSSPSTAQFPAPSGFEPRPITPRSASGNPRQPISIRPQMGSSLGSKHGDLVVSGQAPSNQFIPSAPSPNLRGGNGIYGDSTPASSGYFTPTGTSVNASTASDGKRTITAGAFRRPVGGGGMASSSPGINVNGGRSFAPSGYNVGPGSPGFDPSPDGGPSDAEQIARHWRSSGAPIGAVQQAQEGYGAGGEEMQSTPSFDTRPLQVNKNRMSMGGVGRPGSVP